MEAFIKAILNASITASYIAVAVAVLRIFMKKAPKFITVLLWGLVALRLVLPVLPESNLSLIPDPNPITSVTQGDDAPPTADTPDITPPVTGTDDNIQPSPPVSTTPDNDAVIEQEQQQQVTSTPEKTSPWRIAFWVWVAGVGAMLIYAFISWRRVLGTVREAIPTEGRAWVCDGIPSPFILGVIRPRVYMPAHLSEADTVYVTAHENAHIKRGDHLWKPLGFLLLSLHWFNPVMWIAYILLCRDIELACDEKAINALGAEHKKPYSHALISCSAKSRLISACPLAFGEGGVKGRIKTVLNYKKPAFWIIIVSLIACIAAGVVFLTNPKTSDTPDKAEVVGTWYGNNGVSIGESFRFDEDGKGLYVNCYGEETAINWAIEDGDFIITEQELKAEKSAFHSPYGCTLEDGILELYHYCDCPGTRLSKTKPAYGNYERLVSDIKWASSNESIVFTFNADGTVSGKLNGKPVSYNWWYNTAHSVVIFVAPDGTTYNYGCEIHEDYLVIDLGGFSFKLEPLTTAEDGTSLTDKVLVGTWYGVDTQNAGKKYVFESNGEGSMSFGFRQSTFTWRTVDGVVSLTEDWGDYFPENPTGGKSHTELGYEIRADVLYIDGLRYSATPVFEGDEVFLNADGWMEKSEGKRRFFFHKGGLMEIWTYEQALTSDSELYSTPHSTEYCAWKTDSGLLYYLKDSGAITYYYGLADNGDLQIGKSTVMTLVPTRDYFNPETDSSADISEPTPTPDETFYTLKDGVLTVSGTGAMTPPPDWATGYATAKKLIIAEGITSIPDNAFSDYTMLEDISFPDSLTKIGNNAFSGCTSLKEVTLPQGLRSLYKTFDGCTSLKRVILPRRLNSFSANSFEGCTALEELVLAEETERFFVKNGLLFSKSKVPYSNNYTIHLEYCPKGKQGTVTVDVGIAYFNTDTFKDCTRITKVVFTTGIDLKENMFYGCTALKEVHISNKGYEIEKHAFAGCPSLEALVFGGTTEEWALVSKHSYWRGEGEPTVKKVICTNGTVKVEPFTKFWTLDEEGTFTLLADGGFSSPILWEDDKDKIKTVVIKEGVTTIIGGAFSGCTNLTRVIIPDSVKIIDSYAFGKCTALTEISLPDGVTSSSNWFDGCTALRDVKLPARLETLGNSIFKDCTSLTEVTLPSTLKTIYLHAFDGCTALTAIHIPDSVTKIGGNAFSGCVALKTVTGCNGVKTVDYAAFSGTKISNIGFLKNAEWFGEYVFGSCLNLKTAVLPEGVKNTRLYMFYGSAVETLHVPVGIEYIDSYTFSDTKTLELIYFGGTVAEWNKVSLLPKWLGDDLSATVNVICKDGAVVAANVDGNVDYGP